MIGNRSLSKWLVPAIITITTIAASVSVFGNISSPFRVVIVLWFLLVCPGMAYIDLLEIKDKFTTWTLAVALSLALDTAVSLIVLYTNRWSAALIIGILAALTLSGIALQFWKSRQIIILKDSKAG